MKEKALDVYNGKLSDLEIQKKDFIELYNDGERLNNLYDRIKPLVDKGRATNQIIESCSDLSETSATIRDRISTIKSGGKPQVTKGVDFLEKFDLLPMDMDNVRLPLLNLLSSFSFWRGTHTSSQNSFLHLQYDSYKKELAENILEALYARPKNEEEFHRIRNFPAVANLQMLTGLQFFSTKKSLPVPAYINAAFNSLQDIPVPEKEEHLAINLLKDFISTLFVLRELTNKKVRNLIALETKEEAETQSSLISNIANTAFYPDLEFHSSGVFENTDGYYGILGVNKNKPFSFEDMKNQYNLRVSKIIEANRGYINNISDK